MTTLRLIPAGLGLTALLLTAAHADALAGAAAPVKTAPAMTAAAKDKDTDKDGDKDGDEKAVPAQATVAAKTVFETVSASDFSVTLALRADALAAAGKQIGKMGSFQGTVTQVYSPKNHRFVALDFAPHYKDALTADIAPADYAKFPDLSQLAGKHVLVSGKFIAHGAATQLAVTRPDQIKIIP